MEIYTGNGRVWYEEEGQLFTDETVVVAAEHDTRRNLALTRAVQDFVEREGVWKIEIVPTTRGAVSHCEPDAQQEPVWLVRAYFPLQEEYALAQPTPGLFDED